jgi:carbamoyltransferase
MNILGIYGALGWDTHNDTNWTHDSGATLFINGKHVCSIQEERLTKYKYDGNYPENSINYCLSVGNITAEDIDFVILPSLGDRQFHIANVLGELYKFIHKNFSNAKYKIISHHEAHAYSAIYSSDCNDGCYVILDGGGSNITADLSKQLYLETSSFGYFDKKKNIFRHFATRDFVGLYYQSWAHHIYCHKTGKDISPIDHRYCETFSGKVMGLSAYGKKPDTFDSRFHYEITELGYPSMFFKVIPVDNDTMKSTGIADFSADDKASYLQSVFENAIVDYFEALNDRGYLEKNICLSGGIFLNILGNTLLKKHFPNNNFHISPFVSDPGLHFGAACYGVANQKETISLPTNIALLGKEYSREEISLELKNSNLNYKEFTNFNELCDVISVELDNNKIIGWFQGRSEYGPRALGSRSILMSPKKKENKNILNSKVKHREYWRPFAGVILSEYVSEYFEEGFESPYMCYSQTVKSEKISEIPAITHEDNTCRVQTVSPIYNLKLTNLLNSFKDRSGIPVLLNTSFNDNGKPIIETPKDAIEAFLNMNIDHLVIENFLIYKD